MRSRLLRYARDQIVPAVVTAGLELFERAQWINVVPADPKIEQTYGSYGLFLAVSASLVSSAAFIRENQDYGVSNFLLTVLAGLAMLPPFIVAPYGYSFGLYPAQFSVVVNFAFLGLHVAAGIFIGGIWTVILKTFYR